MAARFSILLIARNRIVRADVLDGSISTFRAGIRHADLAADAAVDALKLEQAPARRVYLMLDEIFTQTLNLNVSQVSGLNPSELQRALAFELEPLSGISPLEAVLGYRTLKVAGGMQTYDIALTTQQQLDGLQTVLRANGAMLAGVGHPRSLSESSPPTDNEELLRDWLNEAVKLLDCVNPLCALIVPRRPPASVHKLLLVGAAAFVLAALACFAHFKPGDDERAALQAQLEQRTQSSQSLAELSKNMEASRKELEKLKAENERAAESSSFSGEDLIRQRAALGSLLEQLANAQPEDAVVEAIDSQNHIVTVSGISLQARQADEWVARLSSALQSAGWGVQPVRKTALRLFPDGGPHAFTIQLQRKNAAAPALQSLAVRREEIEP